MKNRLQILVIVLLPFLVNAQRGYPDSLKLVLEKESIDSNRYELNSKLSDFYEEKNFDSSLYFAEQAVISF